MLRIEDRGKPDKKVPVPPPVPERFNPVPGASRTPSKTK